jgi:hypothetical protein
MQEKTAGTIRQFPGIDRKPGTSPPGHDRFLTRTIQQKQTLISREYKNTFPGISCHQPGVLKFRPAHPGHNPRTFPGAIPVLPEHLPGKYPVCRTGSP